MVDTFDIQQSLKRQLATQKHLAKTTAATTTELTNENVEPVWLQNLHSTVQHQQATTLTRKFSNLLKQLPLVAKTSSAAAINTYLEQVIAELAKIYYVRLRLVELNGTMTATEREKESGALLHECQTHFAHILVVLNQLTEDHE